MSINTTISLKGLRNRPIKCIIQKIPASFTFYILVNDKSLVRSILIAMANDKSYGLLKIMSFVF